MARSYIPSVPSGEAEADSYFMKNWMRSMAVYADESVNVAPVQTANFTCRENQFYPCITSGGALTVKLPPSIENQGRRYTIKNYDGANIITVTPDATKPDTIEGAATNVIPAVAGIAMTYVADGFSLWYVDCCDEGGGGAGIAGITLEEEGVVVGAAAGITTLNIVGGGATATGAGATGTITIPTVDITTQEEGVNLSTTVDVLNFVGAGVTASGAGATTTVTIPGGIAGLTLKEEGAGVGTAAGITSIDIVGPAITATGAGAAGTITLPEMVASGGSHARGTTPDTPSTAGTIKYLREDATWTDPTILPTLVGGSLGGKRTGYFVSNTASFTASWGNLAVATVAGSHTTSASTNKSDSYLAQNWHRMTSTAPANNNALAQVNSAGPTSMWFSGTALSGGFYFKGRAGVNELWVSGWAQFHGLRNALTNPAGGTAPSAFVDCAGIGYDAADANLQVMTNDNAGTCTKNDLGASFAIATKQMYDYELWCFPNSATLYYRVVNLLNNAVATGSIASNTPVANTTLQWVGGYVTNGATAVAASVDFGGAFYETIG